MIRLKWPGRRKPAAAAPAADLVPPPQIRRDTYEFSPRLVVAHAPTVGPAPAFRKMALEILERQLRRGRRGLAVCGVAPGAGVSTTAANIAVALANDDVPTLLVEGNLRHPGLADIIRPPEDRGGVQQLLRGETNRAAAIHHDILPNFSVLYAGGAAADANELVGSPAFAQMVRDSMRDYACVIVDTPPANQCADARAIAIAMQYAVIVGRRDQTFVEDAGLLAEHLRQDGVQLVGTIFNEG